MDTLAHPLRWNSGLSIPILPRRLHSITANPQLQNRVQTSKRKSQNQRAQCAVAEFSAFLDHRRWAFSPGCFKMYARQCPYTQTQENTHSAHMHKAAVSHSAKLVQRLRTSSRSVKLKKLVSVASPLRRFRHFRRWASDYFGTCEVLIRSIKALF